MKHMFNPIRSMIPFLLLLLISNCGASSATEAAPPAEERELESPHITVRVAGLPAGTARIIGTFTDQRYLVDSAQISSTGEIVFQREEPYQPGFVYLVFPSNQYLQVLIDADQTFTMTTRLNDLIGAMEVEGSEDNELLYRNLKFEAGYQDRLQPIQAQLNGMAETDPAHAGLVAQRDALIEERNTHLEEIFAEYPNSFFTAFKSAGQNPQLKDLRLPNGSKDDAGQVYWYRMEFWDNVDLTDERLLYTPVISNKLNRYITELTAQNPDSIIASTDFLVEKVLDQPEYFKFFVNWVALNYEPTKTSLMDSEAVFVHMIKNYFTYDRAFWSDSAEVYALQLRADEMGQSLVGQKGPNVTAPDPNGQMRSIYDLTADYIIVYMYNPDCEHCQEQTPKLIQYYNQQKANGIEVYGIAVDTDDTAWRNYMAQTGMSWTSVFDPTNKAIYKTYYVNVTPELYILNPERIIIGKNLKVAQIQEVIDRDRAKR